MSRKLTPEDIDFESLDDALFIKSTEDKLKTQRRLAISSLLGTLLIVFALIYTPVPIEKITALSTIISTALLGLLSIVGGFLGFSTWMTSKSEQTYAARGNFND